MLTKILILGGNGFIGRNLISFFAASGQYEVLAPARSELNLLNDSACSEYLNKHKPDFVVHSAVDITSVENTLKMFFNVYNNRRSFKRLIQLGSGAEYDKRFSKPLITESEFGQSVPIDTYGLAKYTIAREIEQSNDDKTLNLRLFGIYGPHEDYSRRFISNNICRVLAGLPISMNKNMRFDYINVIDLANVLNKIISGATLTKRSYNFCSGQPIDFLSIANKIKQCFGFDVPILVAQQGENPEYSGSPKRIMEEMGDLNMTSIDKSILDLIEFYKETLTTNDLESFAEKNFAK
jgi:UDP-glucose 4-epimerase